MTLGEHIHALRKAAGLSQEALGQKLGVVSQTVSKWERGESVPDAALLVPLADALRVSLDALFGRTPGDEAMETSLLAWLRPKSEPERTEALLRLHRRQLELSLGILDEEPDRKTILPEIPKEVRYTWLGKNDLAFYCSHPACPASFIFREPEAGWEALFEEPERFRTLWEALGDPETLRAAKKILSIPADGVVAREALDALLGLEHPERSIPLLERLDLLYFNTLTVDGKETEVCFFIPDPAVLALLALAQLLFDRGRGEAKMYVSGGGWHARPPLYRGEAPADPSFWYKTSDLW
ncbi:MAG: helix-turn-helix transcriptional regulator [Oscillospiraceae bacterium]|nr:helix-turn-helix transcriptional regulator [Oscillospiraceae bacterium]